MEGSFLLASPEEDDVAAMELPPGFRFHPTDEEIIMHYLLKKVLDRGFKATAISEADLNKCEPWDLPKKAKMGEKEWFFFFQRDKKYPTGMRTNRATESGYWKATGKDREINYKSKSCLVGMKKTLVFYKGRAPKGVKTNWVMHEYRLEGKFSNHNISRAAKEEFVVCRVFHKNTGIRTRPAGFELARIDSFVDHLFVDHSWNLQESTHPLMDYTNCSNNTEGPCSRFAAQEEVKSQEHNISSSSSVFLNNHKLKYQQYFDPKNYFVPLQDTINSFSGPLNTFPSHILYPQSSLGYQYHEGLGLMMSSYQPNGFPFKTGHDQENVRLMTPKMEQYLSGNNSEETGLSTENVGNETTSLQSNGDVESKNIKPFDYQEMESLGFSPGISDLDSMWRY